MRVRLWACDTDTSIGSKGETKNKKVCKFGDCFDRIVADEAHNLKSTYAETHAVVLSMTYKAIWFLTATPYLNKVSDFGGYLHLMWSEEWAKDLPQSDASPKEDGEDGVDDVDDVDDAEPVPKALDPDAIRDQYAGVVVDPDSLPVHLLNPRWFYSLLYKGDIPIRDAWKIVPIMAQMIFLKRNFNSMATYMEDGEEVRRPIGSEIPRHRVCTVELKFSSATQKEHDGFYFPLLDSLAGKGGGKEKAKLGDGLPAEKQEEGRINFAAYRRLSHLGFSPKLERLALMSTSKGLAEEVRRWAAKWDDGGATFLFNKTKRDPAVLPPQDNMAMSYFLAWDSPRLQYLCHIIRKVVINDKRRLAAIARWPQSFWLVYLLLRSLGLVVDVIHAGMKPEERVAAVKKFNDSKSDSQIFLTTYSCGGIGLNLHHMCSDLVLLEPAVSVNITKQAFGRINRLGQAKEQQIWILFQQHSFNRSEEFNAAKKMINELSSEFSGSFASYVQDAIDEAVTQHKTANSKEATVGEETIQIEAAADAEAEALITVCDRLLQAMLGQNGSRLAWDDWHDLGFDGFDRGQNPPEKDEEGGDKGTEDAGAKPDEAAEEEQPKTKKQTRTRRGVERGRKTLRTPMRKSKKIDVSKASPSPDVTPSKDPKEGDPVDSFSEESDDNGDQDSQTIGAATTPDSTRMADTPDDAEARTRSKRAAAVSGTASSKVVSKGRGSNIKALGGNSAVTKTSSTTKPSASKQSTSKAAKKGLASKPASKAAPSKPAKSKEKVTTSDDESLSSVSRMSTPEAFKGDEPATTTTASKGTKRKAGEEDKDSVSRKKRG